MLDKKDSGSKLQTQLPVFISWRSSGREAGEKQPLEARPNTKRIENQKEDEDAVEKKDEDWAHDCTIDIVSPHLNPCIPRHTYLIGSL
jgi:hypothetical protein